MRRDPWVVIALVAFFALLCVALFGGRIAPHEPIYYVLEHGRDPRPFDPGVVFPFGSDVLGRDVFSVVLAGAGPTLAVVAAGGLARVAAGVLLALVGAVSWRSRIAIDSCAGLASAVPATIIALLLVKVFVKTDTSILVFVGALLVTGWAGPYRVVRVELDRLAHLGFTESAAALGVGRTTIITRHHVPHLVPLVAMNASQQIVASLVLVAELGVLGVVVGPSRAIDVTESLGTVRFAARNDALVSELSDWGGLLANASARTIDTLWVTRWLFIVPGVAFALTAIAVSMIGFAIARRYARRNVFNDLRGGGTAVLIGMIAAVFVVSAVVPERHAGARDWADRARSAVVAVSDPDRAFADAGLRPIGESFAVERDTTKVLRSGPTIVRLNGASVDDSSGFSDVRALVDADTGGRVVDAPLVFVSRGVSQADYQPQRTSFFAPPDLGTVIAEFADDYAGVDVRGKIVVLLRFFGVASNARRVNGPDVETAIDNALKRGAAAVLFVDPQLSRYVDVATSARTIVNPYRRLEDQFPIRDPDGVPVVVLSVTAANRLLSGTGLQISDEMSWLDFDGPETKTSRSRDLGVPGHVEVSLRREAAHITSFAGEIPARDPKAARIVVWSVRGRARGHASVDVAAALARVAAPAGLAFVFIDFDPSVDEAGNARQIKELLAERPIRLIVVLDGLHGSTLKFTSPFGDLIPAIDFYADQSGARHLVTRSTIKIDNWQWPGSSAYPDTRAVLVQTTGAGGDARQDAAALLGYLAGRSALGAEELQ